MSKHSCVWVKRSAIYGIPALYCCQPVEYHMVENDDGYQERQYEAFCPEHLVIVASAVEYFETE